MRRSRKPIVIASRRSRLARIQAEMVGSRLASLHPSVHLEYLWLESEGDQRADVMLADHVGKAGGKGLFTRGVDELVMTGKADIAVHSLKDLPAKSPPGLALAAVLRRADVRDCLISQAGCNSIAVLAHGAVVGTASPRRASQLLVARPDLHIQLIRGNVETRLDKVLKRNDGEAFDATLLAKAGLDRLEISGPNIHALSTDEMLPAAGQAAIAVHCRADDHVALTRCLPLNDPATSTAVNAEREVLSLLGADCNSSIAAFAEPTEPGEQVKRNADAHWFRLRIGIYSPDGSKALTVDESVRTRELRRLVKRAVKQLKAEGADKLLRAKGGWTNGGKPSGAGAQITREGEAQRAMVSVPMD